VRAVAPELVALSAISEGAEGVRATLEQLMAALPPRTKVVVGGAAALRLKSTVTALGALVVESPEEWEQLLA